MKRAWVGSGLLVGLFLAVVPAQAQVGAARGKVLDDKEQPVEGAKVVLEYLGGVTRKAETTTNKKGEFTRVGLSPGPYRITASKDGFAPQYIELRVTLGDPTEVPAFKLVAAGAAAAGQKEGESLQAAFDKAYKASQEGRFDEAEAAYQEVLAKNPSRPEVVWANMGHMYIQKKDLPAAENAFRKSVEAKPDFSDGYAGLASVLITAGQGPQAVEAVTKAATDFPQDGRMQFVYGWTLFNTGKAAEADEVLKKAETLDPQNAETQYYLGSIAVGQNKIPEAVAYLEKYLTMSPTNTQNVATAQALIAALKKK